MLSEERTNVKRRLLFLLAGASTIAIAQATRAQALYWTPSSGTESSWGTASNWSDVAAGGGTGTVPGATHTPTFNTTGNNAAAVVALDADRAALGMNFNTGGGTTITAGAAGPFSLTLGTGGMTMGATSGTVVLGSTTANLNVPILLAGNQSWVNSSTAATNHIFNVRSPVSAANAGTTTLTIGGTVNNSSALNTISGAIGDGAGTVAVTMAPSSGGNRWTLSGANTYSGTTTVSTGALTIGSTNALGSVTGATTVASGAGLFFRSSIGTIAAEPLTLAGQGPGNLGALRNVNGINNWTGPITATTSSTVSIGSDASLLTIFSTGDITTTSASAALNFQGAGNTQVNSTISGPAPVTKTGTGTLTYFFDTKTYTGTTTVTAGTLQVDTNVTATSAVTVATTGTLRGSAAAVINTGASVTVNGTIAAGASASNISNFTTGPLSITSTGALSADIDGTSVLGDLITVVGNLTIDTGNTATLNVADLAPGAPLAAGTSIPLIDYSGTWNGGLFTMAGVGVLTDNGTTFFVGATQYQLDYDFGGVNGAVALVAVPEPGTAMLLPGVLLLGLRRRRVRR